MNTNLLGRKIPNTLAIVGFRLLPNGYVAYIADHGALTNLLEGPDDWLPGNVIYQLAYEVREVEKTWPIEPYIGLAWKDKLGDLNTIYGYVGERKWNVRSKHYGSTGEHIDDLQKFDNYPTETVKSVQWVATTAMDCAQFASGVMVSDGMVVMHWEKMAFGPELHGGSGFPVGTRIYYKTHVRDVITKTTPRVPEIGLSWEVNGYRCTISDSICKPSGTTIWMLYEGANGSILRLSTESLMNMASYPHTETTSKVWAPAV